MKSECVGDADRWFGQAVCLVAAAAFVAAPASAIDRVWLGPTGIPPGDGSSFNDALNWSPTGVPNALDTAIFDGIGGDVGGSVLFGNPFTNNQRVIARGNTPPILLSLQGNIYLLNATEALGNDRSFVLAPDPGNAVEVQVLDGTMIAGHAGIAAATGTQAAFRVLAGATVIFVGEAGLGEQGNATVQIGDASAVITLGAMTIARDNGSSAEVTLVGPATVLTVGGSLHVGGSADGDGGVAGISISDGAALSSTGEVIMHPDTEATLSGGSFDAASLRMTAATFALDASAFASIGELTPSGGRGLFVGGAGPTGLELLAGSRLTAEFVSLASRSRLSLDASRLESSTLSIDPLAVIDATFAPGSANPGAAALLASSGTASLSGRVSLAIEEPPPPLGESIDLVDAAGLDGAFLVTTTPLLGGLNFIDLAVASGGNGARVVAEVKTLDQRLAVEEPTTSPLPAPPNLLTVAAFGGDPLLLDAAVTIPGATPREPGSLVILTNTLPAPGGQPGYIELTAIEVGADPKGLGNGDLAGRGRNDLVVSSRGAGAVTIVLNQGSPLVGSAFDVSQIIDIGGEPGGLGIANIDGIDGLDIIVAQASLGSFTVLFNNGSGFFAAGSTVPAGTGTQGVNPLDLDDDKDVDVVALNSGAQGDPSSATVTVHKNLLNKSGTFAGFAPGVPYSVGPDPVALATGDLNGDGFPEIVTAHAGDGTISLLVNRGDGTFEPAIALDAGGAPTALALIDLDNDPGSDLDIALIVDNARVPSLTVFRNDTTDGFLVLVPIFEAQSVFGIPAALAGGNADGEGPDDLILAGAGVGGGVAQGVLPGAISVQISKPIGCLGAINGDGVVNGADLAILLGAWGPNPGSPSDLNGDGVVDGVDLSILLSAWGPCP